MTRRNLFEERTAPWDALGKEIKTARTSADMIIEAGLDWEVTAEKIYSNNRLIDGHLANTRSTDGHVLGIVSPRYKVVQNKEAFDFADGLLGQGCEFERAGSLKDGRRIWALAKVPDDITVLGEKVAPYLLITNSHDGTSGIKVALTPIRIACANQIAMIFKTAHRTMTIRHTASIYHKMDEAQQILGLYKEYGHKLNEVAEVLSRKMMPKASFVKFLDKLIPMPERKLDAQGALMQKTLLRNTEEKREELTYRWRNAPDLANYRDTAYGALQAVADFTTHTQPKRLSKTFVEGKMNEAIETSALLNKAYKLLQAA